MKQIYHFTGTAGKQQSLKAGVALLLMGVMLTLLPTALQAQVLQPFTQRTSDYSPDMPIYHIKGDYTMIGNTSVTFNPVNLDDDCNNNYNNSNRVDDNAYRRMKYVDVDGTAFSTINSSTAALTFSDEFGANPECSEVLYAGLYWTGRTNGSYVSATTTTPDNIYSGETGGGYRLTITQSGNDCIFTFTKQGSDSIVLTMRKVEDEVPGYWESWSRYSYYVYNGAENQIYDHIPENNRDDNNSNEHTTSSLCIPLPGTNYVISKLHWNSTLDECYATIEEVPTTTAINPWSYGGSQYYLNKIKIKHANESEYTEVTASLANVYGGTSASSNIYAAYAEVTDIVRRNGSGNYTVADLVTNVGQNDGTGWIGCWGMVVVYENSKMKWRDITLFDGFANVEEGNNVTIPISGFKTVQVGDVNVKLGMMAAEGDRGITGDRCGILRQVDGEWQYLYHAGHTTQSADNNNFFNSSIQTGVNYRYPDYLNNTGIDIAMFNIPNENNEVLDNEQTNTSFQFTSSGDLYFPFCFVMGVDAYIPEAEALSGVMNIDEDDIIIDSETGNYLIKPGQEITFEVDVKNFGTEDIVDAKLEIPLPSTIEYYYAEEVYVHQGINVERYFDAERYANGVVGWNIDYIPSGDPNQVYVKVRLTVKVTGDCYVLASTDPQCELAIEVNGTLEGTSYVNRVYFKKESFISGFADETGCQGNAIRNDIKVVVDKVSYVNNNCQDQDYTERLVTVCGNDFSDSNPIPFMDIYALYPQGSRFFNEDTDEEYTAATGFPISLAGDNAAEAALILVQPTSIYSAACTSELRFILDPDGDSFTTPTLTNSATYCLNEQARHLSSHIESEIPEGVYFRFYKANNNSAVAYDDIVPPTDVVGTYTYYVRQFRENAIGCEDETFYGPITIDVVSPIIFRSSEDSPSCIGEEVTITGLPEGGRWSWPENLTGITVSDNGNGNVLTIDGTSAGTYTVTYIHESPGTGSICSHITERSYTHQIAATTVAGTLSADQRICQGAQIHPLEITGHNGHVERWEMTTNQSNGNWDIIPNNTSSISTADLGELAEGTYYFRALVKDGNCEAVWTNTVTITVRADDAPNPPTVTTPQFACIGTTHTIEPSGDNYQWYKQEMGGWPIEDANVVTVTAEYITRYVSVFDPRTNCASDRALVVVRPNLEPGEINSGLQRVCDLTGTATTIGSNRDAVVYGEGTVQYQWYVQENGGEARLIEGATSATFTPSAYMGREGEYIFIRKVKNSTCANWQQSRGEWRLVVGKPDASIVAVPEHAIICAGAGVELQLSVPPSTAYSYQWYRDNEGIPGATENVYIATVLGTYTAQVTHTASGCFAITPAADKIDVKYDDAPPTVSSSPTTDLDACSIADAQQRVPTYSNVADIEKSIADGGLGISISDAITPDNLLTLTYNIGEDEIVNSPDGACYQLVRTYTVTDQCGFSTTFTHTINVVDREAPSIGTIEVPAAVPAGSCKYKIPDLSAVTLAVSSDNCRDVSFVEQTPAAGSEYSQTNTEYTVTVFVKVKDACGNETIKEVQITIPAIPTISAAGSALDCYGDSDGNISYTITGGTAGYTVVLSGGSANQTANQTATGTYTFTDLKAGTYTVTVTDANGCQVTASAIVDEPAALTASATPTHVSCNGGNGSVALTVSGGTTPYSYVWSNDATTEDLSSVPAGTYTVTVADAHGCQVTASATVEQPAALTASAVATNALCNGGNGSIALTVSGGTTPYRYAWSNEATTEDLSSVSAGTYTVTVTDANGCTATASATVSEPSALSVSLTKVDETCAGNDGKINYTIEGGTAGYTVVLIDSSANQIANQTATDTNTFTGLKAGTYTVTVTDRNTCVATATATIAFNNNFTVSARDTAICSGATFTINPEASHTANYSWAAPTATGITGAAAGTNASNISGTLTNTDTSATSITYTVAATTANGLCTAASPFEVEVTVYAPVTGGSIQKDSIVCNVADTIVKLTNVTAGNGGYGGTYGWEKSTDNGTTWTTIPNSNGAEYTPSYHDNLGIVLYRRMYSANCDEEPSNTVSVTYYGNIVAGDVICTNGCAENYCSGSNISVTLSTSNITVQSGASYSIQWQQSTDNGATWTNISEATSATYTYTNSNFTSPIQFRYTITVTGCEAVSSNSVHSIGVWELPVVSIADVATLCPSAASTDIKGTIVTTTTSNYTYYWSPGSGLELSNLPESATSATSNTITGTFPTADCNATYSASLYVIDGHGCKSDTDTETFTVVDTVAPVIRSGYADTVEATVSNCAYTYPDLREIIRRYSTDNCTDSLIITQSSAQGTPIAQIAEAQDLPVTVTVKDSCNKETTTTIYVTVPAQLKLAETHRDETCNESNNGTIDLTVTGGKENYTYSWQKDSSSYSPATQDLSGLEAGTYTVTVADAHGCTATISAIIKQPEALQLSITDSSSLCYDQADGYINYTFSGGTPVYTVSIGTATNKHAIAENGSFTGSFTNLADGPYTVTVTDTNGCTTTDTTIIEQINDTLTITAQSHTWEYDGQLHTQPYYNVTFGSEQYSNIASDSSAILPNGDVVTATVSGSITNAGTKANTVTGVTVTRGNTDVKCYYNIDTVAGVLKITPKPVTITADSDSKEYDGTELTNDGYTSEGLAEGDAIARVTVEGSQTVVGSSANVPSAAVIVNAAGDTVTASYDIRYVNGTLEVTQKVVTITADSDSKEYDGTPLTKNSYTNTTLAEGDSIYSVTVTGSITEVGTVDNVPSDAVIMDGEEDVTDNYTITYVNGTLAVTPRPVTLTSATDSKIYDGTPLTNSTVTVGGDGFVTGEGATYDVTGTITNVGSCYNTFTYTLNSNTDANNYTIDKIEGILTILIDSVPPCIGCDSIAGVSCETIGNQTRTNDENQNYYTHSGTAWDVNATDNSGAIPVMTWSLTGVTTASGNSTLDGQRFNVGVTTVTWTATDVTGNTATCQFTVTVADTTAPVISCPSDIAGIACITDVPAAYADYAAFQTAGGELTDNDVVDYESFALVDADTNGTCPTTITRTYYIEDTTGNSATCTQVITIKDSIAPVLTGTWPSDSTGQDNCLANRNISGLMSNDAVKALYSDCNTFTVSHKDTVTGNNCGWTVTRTYTITDLCENTVMPKPTMSVSGSDQTAPYIMPTVLDRTLTATGCEFRIPDMREEVRAISSDGCTGNSALTVEQPSAGMQVYPQAIARDTNVIIRVTDSCGNYSLKSVKITIPAKVVITATATPASICNGETAQLSTTVTNVVGAASYVWEPSTGLNSTTIYNPTTTLTATGASDTVTYTVMVTDANGCTATATTFVTVNPKVVMDTVANQAICHGSEMAAVNFTTPITDGSVDYNWSRDNNNIGGLAMSGIGNIAAATLTNTTNTAQTTTITVTPVYANNGKTCTDETITFTITVYPKVVMDTVADQAICHGSAITAVNFSSDLSGGDIIYTWRRTNSNIGGLDMSDTGNIPATVLTNTTNTVQVDTITVTPVYTNNGNECTDETITFTITVNPKVVMNDVADQAICHGSAITAVNFTTPITDGSVDYNWSRNNENIEGLEMSGIGNIAAVTLTNTTNTAQVDTIIVTPVYTNNGKTCTDETITFTITVNPKVVMDTVADQAICHGSAITAVNFTTPITDGSVVYNWSRNNDSIGGLAMSGAGNIPDTVLTNTTNTVQVDTITVTPVYTNNGKTCTDETITFTITVNPKVVMNDVLDQAICHGSAITAVNFTTPITDGSVDYNWSRNNDSISGLAMSGTGNIPATVLTNTTNRVQVDTITVTPVYTNNGNECTDESITFTITVNPKVVMNDVLDQAICHGSEMAAVNFTTPITDGSVVYNWSRDNNNIGGLDMSGTGNIAAATLTNTTNTAQTTTITVTPVYTNNEKTCTDESITFTITVNPEVVMDTVEDWTLCVGETSPEYVYTSTITDGTVTYGWSNDNSAIGLAAAGSGNLPSFVAANSTSADLIAEVKVAPTYTNNDISCQGDSINFHITVRPSIKTPGNVAFTCPADTTVVLSYSECEQFVNIGYPEFVNNMTDMDVVITNDAPADSIFPEGTTIVTWTATDECGATLTCTQSVVIQFPSCGDSIADFDGYRYSSVRIGCQCWTGENARSEHYSDGTPVDNFRYYNDSDSLENIYGKLYTWYTAVRVPEGDDTAVPADSIDPLGNSYVQGICPEGWALPTVDEYMLMIANSGDATHAKDGSNLYWLPGYEGQPPFSGFDAYGAGKYNGAIDRYQELLGKTYFWTTLSGSGSETATTVEINYYCAEGLQTELSKGDGVSIRCIRKR